jgi:hypothetical protein
MIDRAIDAGVGTIVIGDPERPTFHEMADKVTESTAVKFWAGGFLAR